MTEFLNFYQCYRCGHEWTDVWSSMVDDDCPKCGARHVSPHKSEDAGAGEADAKEPRDETRPATGGD